MNQRRKPTLRESMPRDAAELQLQLVEHIRGREKLHSAQLASYAGGERWVDALRSSMCDAPASSQLEHRLMMRSIAFDHALAVRADGDRKPH